jgi:dolichyl-phosphate-mannose-protein mannosyltransferase
VKLNLGLEINKKDILTIVLLSIIFFSIAIVNLGSNQVPVNGWQTTQDQTIQVDLGKTVYVSQVYLLVKNGSANVQVSTDLQNSSLIGPIKIEYPVYYVWKNTTIDADTRYVRLDFQQANVEITELAILDQNNQKLPITTVTSENFSDPTLPKLIDEQNLVTLPQTYMSETMFDEIYFVRTAEQYLNLQLPYEWTHPPLGKIILATGIAAFGFNPFGWRIMGVIFAMLLIPLMYLLGKKLFESWIGGFTAAFLLTFDFMHFTMARMATVDTFVVFFSVASQLFFLIYLKGVLKNGWKTSVVPLFFAILFFAFGFSTKWLVLYGFIGQLAILAFIRLKEVKGLKGKLSGKIYAFFDQPYSYIVEFLLIAIGIYFLTYLPDMLAGRSFLDVIGLQGSMYAYHSGLIATHPFSSAWWAWPLMSKPVWLYVSYLPNNMKSTITLMGNPAVWWVGFASVIAITGLFLRQTVPAIVKHALSRLLSVLRGTKKINNFPALKIDFPLAFIVVLFFFQWVPYVFISRIVFIYHFYVSVPFLCLGSAYFINKYWSNKWGKVAAIIFFTIVVAVFALFYSVISGAPASSSSIDGLKWFGGWFF